MPAPLKLYDFGTERLTADEIAVRVGCCVQTVYRRVSKGVPLDQPLDNLRKSERRSKGRTVRVDGEDMSISAAAIKLNVSSATVRRWMDAGKLSDERSLVESGVFELEEEKWLDDSVPYESDLSARAILRLFMRDSEFMTLDEIGAMYGLSRESIRQDEARAFNKLRRHHPRALADMVELARMRSDARGENLWDRIDRESMKGLVGLHTWNADPRNSNAEIAKRSGRKLIQGDGMPGLVFGTAGKRDVVLGGDW